MGKRVMMFGHVTHFPGKNVKNLNNLIDGYVSLQLGMQNQRRK